MAFLAIYVALLGGLLVAVWRRPPVAVAALVCVQVLDFWGQMASAFVAENGRITNVYIVVLLGIAVLRAFNQRRRLSFGFSTSSWLLLALWLYALVSVFWTPVPDIALAEWGRYWPYMLLALFVVPMVIATHADAAVAMRALIVLGGLLAILVDVFVRWDGRYVVAFWSDSAKFWNALAFAQMAGYAAIAAALMNTRSSVLWIVVRVVVIGACMVLAVKSGSRGQFILMVGLSLLLLPVSRENRNWRAYLSVLMLVAIVGAASYLAFDYFSESGDQDRWSRERLDADLEGRMSMATTVLTYWWRAAGSNFAVLLFGLGNSASFSPSVVGYYPHMVPVEVLAEEGLLGFALFAVLNIVFVVRALQAIRECGRDPERRGVVAALTGMYAFAALLSLKQGSLLNMSAEIFLFLLVLERVTLTYRRQRVAGSISADTTVRPGPRRYANLCP